MIEPRDETCIVLDKHKEFTHLGVISGKKEHGSPLVVFTSPLFIIGNTNKLSKEDAFWVIYHVNRWMGLSAWGLNLGSFDNFSHATVDGLLKTLAEEYNFQFATSLDYVQRWQDQHGLSGMDPNTMLDLDKLDVQSRPIET